MSIRFCGPDDMTVTTPNPTSRSWRDWPKPSRLALIAGDGQLPCYVAENAIAMGIEVFPFALGRKNADELRKLTGKKPVAISPCLLRKNLALLREANVQAVVFAGKVNKWILLADPRVDDLALSVLGKMMRKGDDDLMLWLVNSLRELGIEVLPQTLFLEQLFLAPGCLTRRQPDERARQDIAYGYQLAKEMGRLDVGQTVVVRDGMLIAVEAIEGTDQCLKRTKSFIKGQGGVVVKVAKPNQDQRFDVPTVGLKTLKRMKSVGLTVLAAEANETLFLEPEEMAAFADRHGMVIQSVSSDMLPDVLASEPLEPVTSL